MAMPVFLMLKRLTRGKDKTPTMSVVLTFNVPDLPDYVYLYHQRYPVRPFVDKPWQCYQCQGFGHSAGQCRSKPRCVLCAGSHLLRDCSVREHEPNVAYKKVCANCKGEHTANYGGCPFVKQAKQIEQVRTLQRLSYRDAASLVKSHRPSPLTHPNVVPLPAISGLSHVSSASCATAGLARVGTTKPVPSTTSVATQTESSVSISSQTTSSSPSLCLDSSVVNDIVVLMVKVLVQAKVLPQQKATAVFSALQTSLTTHPGSLFSSSLSQSSSLSSGTPDLVIPDRSGGSGRDIPSPVTLVHQIPVSPSTYNSHPGNVAPRSPKGTKPKSKKWRAK